MNLSGMLSFNSFISVCNLVTFFLLLSLNSSASFINKAFDSLFLCFHLLLFSTVPSSFSVLRISIIEKFLQRAFQPLSCSKWEVCNKPSISWRWQNVAKVLDFRLHESLKNALSRTFYSPKLSLESWILHSFCKKVALQTSIIVYLILQRFSWFKNYKLLILKPIPDAFFAYGKTISAFVDTGLLLIWVAHTSI